MTNTSKPEKFESKHSDILREGSINVAVAYPTTKKQKIMPLQETITSHIKQQEEKLRISIKVIEFFFEVTDTGVNEQPLHPEGYVGALNRICYIQDALSNRRKWEQSFAQPAISNFQRIIIPSLESDIYETAEEIYDKPNAIFYECFTGHFVAGMGTGPRVEKGIFDLSQRQGAMFFHNSKAVTYGKTLHLLFPGMITDHADWHGVVCYRLPDGKQRDRAYLIEQLCEALREELKKLFDRIFEQ